MFRLWSAALARVSNVPLLLFAAPALVAQRVPSLQETSTDAWHDVQTVDRVVRDFSDNKLSEYTSDQALPSSSQRRDRGSQRNSKKRGFQAVLRWCAIHQQRRAASASTMPEWQSMQLTQAVAVLDAEALQWINANAELFSCSQLMFLVSFLCDVACGSSDPPPTRDGDTNGDEAGASHVARSLRHLISRVVAVLVHRMNASDALESQPLTLQLTAAYALDRLCQQCADTMDKKELDTIEPPAALLFSIVHNVRGGSALSDLCDQSDSKDEAVEAMLTLLLLMTPARRKAVLRDDDHSLLQDVVDRLILILQPLMPLPSWCTHSNGNTNTNRSDDARVRGSSSPDEPVAAPTSEDDRGWAVNEMVRGDSVVRCGTVQECLTLMQNIEFAKTRQRLLCLEYCFRVLRPADQLTSDDVALLPGVFATIESIPAHERISLTDAIVLHCPTSVTPSYHTAMCLLPFLRDPMVYATERVHLTAESVKNLTGAEALHVLSVSGANLPSALTRLLTVTCIRAFVPQQTTTTPATVRLTPTILSLLRCLLEHTTAATSVEPGGDADDDADADAVTETLSYPAALATLVHAVNWHDGLVPEDGATAGPTVKLQHQLLEAFLSLREYLDTTPLPTSTTCEWPSSERFVTAYVEPVLTAVHVPHRTVLVTLARVTKAAWLDEASQRRVLQKAVALSGVASASALARFIDLFALDAVRLGFDEPGITKLLLKQRSLDPHIKIFGSHMASLTGAAYGQRYVEIILTACQYQLQAAATMSPERKEAVRTAASNWIYHCLLSLAAGARRSQVDNNNNSCGSDETAVGDVAADTDVLRRVSDAQFEALLTYTIHFGCKPPPTLLQLLRSRQRMQQESMRSETSPLPRWYVAAASNQEGEEELVDQALTTVAVEDAYPLEPGHFVFAVRLDLPCPLPLTTSYLTALLRRCDLAIFHTVGATFLAALRERRDLPDLAVDFIVMRDWLRVLAERATVTSSSAPLLLTDLSTVTRDVIRGILSQLHRTRMYEEPLKALGQRASHGETAATVTASDPNDNDAADAEQDSDAAPLSEEIQNEDDQDAHEPTAADAGDEEMHTEPSTAEAEGDGFADTETAVTHHGRRIVNDALVALHASISHELCGVVGLLQPEQLKEIVLSNSDRLWEYFPTAAERLFTQCEPYLGDLSPRDLLLLAVRYPPGEDAVTAQLAKCDVRVHVDFGVFLRFAKNLPMSVIMMVTEAHLASLSFAWTARLASSLSTRADTVPTAFLAQVLSRLQTLSEKATDADRSLVLIILQKFIPTRLQHEPLGATDNGHGHMLPDATDVTDDDQQRLDLVRHCCDKLLLLDGVRDMASLEVFVNAYPPTLRSMVQHSVVDQVQQCLLDPLLVAPLTAETLTELTRLIRLLHRHDLLPLSVSRHVYRRTFAKRLPLVTVQHHPLPLPVVVELAVLIGSPTSSAGCAGAAAGDPTAAVASARVHRYGTRALRMVVNRLTSPAERVEALSTIVDMRANATTAPHTATLWIDPDVQRDLCLHSLGECDTLSAREFAALMQAVSRLRLWGVLNTTTSDTTSAADDARRQVFHRSFPTAFARADPHNRCVVLKAISSDADLFRRHEETAMRFMQADVAVLSHEDLELLMSAILLVRTPEVAEAVVDAISTRLLPVVEQCRRSTLVRVMQCHAQFGIHDAPLFASVLRTLEAQSGKELRLDVAQIVTLLQAIASLQLNPPEKLVIACFQQLEKGVDSLTVQQQAQAAELLVALEMAYTPYVHTLVVKVLENREGARHSARLRAAAELLCEAYDVEAPPHLRIPRLRKRRETRRLDHYAEQRRGEVLFAA